MDPQVENALQGRGQPEANVDPKGNREVELGEHQRDEGEAQEPEHRGRVEEGLLHDLPRLCRVLPIPIPLPLLRRR